MRALVRAAQKILGWSLLAVLVLSLVLLAAAGWVVQTESGSRWAIATARDWLPPELQLGAVSGTLSSPLVLHDLEFENAATQLHIARVAVHWQLFDLLERRVTIEQLQISGLRLNVRPTDEPPAAEPLTLPRLPVALAVQQLSVTDVAIVTAPDTQPLSLTRLAAALHWDDRRIAIEELQLRAPLADLDGAATLDFPGMLEAPFNLRRGPRELDELAVSQLQLQLAYQLRAVGLAPASGSLRSSGTLADLQLTLAAQAPYGVAVQAQVRGLLESPRVQLTASANTAALNQLQPDWPAESSARAALELDYGLDRLRIVQASIVEQPLSVLPEQPPAAVVQASGLVELAGPAPQLDIGVRWQHLRWPYEQPPQVRSERGELTLLGVVSDYQARLDAQLEVPEQSDGHLQIEGHGSQTSFYLRSLNLDSLGGTVTAAGTARWSDGVNADATWTIKQLNPGALFPDWPGAVDAAGAVAVKQADAAAALAVSLADVQVGGTLKGAPLSGAVELEYLAPALTIAQARLALGDNRFELSGAIDQNQDLDLQFRLTANALNLLVPDSDGTVSIQGTLGGSQVEPVLRFEATAEELRYEQLRLGQLTASADVGAAPAYDNQMTVQAQELRSADTLIDAVSFKLSGPQTAHAMALAVQAESANLDLNLSGSSNSLAALANAEPGAQYTFALQQFSLLVPEQPPWELAAAAGGTAGSGRVTPDAANLEPLCLVSADARVCLGGSWSGSKTRADLELTNVSLARLEPWLPPELLLHGSVSGAGSLAWQNAQPAASLAFRTSAIAVRSIEFGPEDQPVTVADFAPGTLELTGLAGEPLQLQFELPLDTANGAPPGGLDAQVTLLAGSGGFSQRPLQGTITAQVDDVSGWAALLPEVSRLAGGFESALSFAGSLEAPRVTGHLLVRNAEAALIGPEITLRDINLEARAENLIAAAAVPVRVQGTMASGKGTLNLSGDLRYSASDLSGEMTLAGERFLLVNNEQAELLVSPDLKLELQNRQLNLRGTLAVPEADIVLKQFPESAVVVSDDQVIVGTETRQREQSFDYDAQVTLSLGDKVHFKGFGLDADFAGDLRVSQATGEPGLGRGEIRITRGRYQAYGQDLSIETGRALWTNSPLDQPGLDLRAVRKPRPDIAVGVRARGRLNQPDFSLFSEPVMSESDQLSYLVLGRPLEDNSSAESSLMSQAALALGIRGGNFLSDQFGDKLGVDSMGIETEAGAGTSGAAFVVGKYLSPKLYVSYGLGLLDSVSTLKLEYLLSSKWRLVTESSTIDSGGDLIYTIERR
ncbi:MAG: translocation/assembly module TamB domain-containing protein [Pseudomonadales bacterium]